MKVVIDKAGTIRGRWRGDVTELSGFTLDPPQFCVENEGVNMFAPEADRFSFVSQLDHTVRELGGQLIDVEMCDACRWAEVDPAAYMQARANELIEQLRDVLHPRPCTCRRSNRP